MTKELLSAILLSSLACEAVAGIIQLDTWKQTSSPPTSIGARQSFQESIINNVTGGSYMISTCWGTPCQNISLVLDTGSSDVWALANNADQCTSATIQRQYGPCVGGTYNPSSSSTYRLLNSGFDISYADGSASTGNYIADTLAFGGNKIITNQTMGVALKTTVGVGIMGIGYNSSESTRTIYPSVIDMMTTQGLTRTKAFSLYLNDLQASTGSILFGGIDTAKYSGNLIGLPIQPDVQTGGINSFTVALSGVSATGSAGNTTTFPTTSLPAAVVLDSGTTLTYLPPALTSAIYSQFSVNDQTTRLGEAIIDCAYRNSGITLNYSFGGTGGPTIKVDMNELVFTYAISRGVEICAFGIQSSGTSGLNLLGDTFLRSAYVVYDISANQVALAQTVFNVTTSNLQEITPSGIPLVSGIATSATVRATGTQKPGVGVRTTVSNGQTIVVTQTAAATSSRAAGSHVAIPRFEWSGVAVLGLASVVAMVGGAVFVNAAL